MWVCIFFHPNTNIPAANVQLHVLASSLYSSQCRRGQVTFCGLHYAWTMKVNNACQVTPLPIDIWIGIEKLAKVNLRQLWIASLSQEAVLIKAGNGSRCIWIAVTS